MAQGQLNQTIAIGIDMAKLDADIRIAKVKLQDFGKAANAAARQAVTTGAPTDRATADAASRAYTNQEKALAGLTRQKKESIAVSSVSAAAVRKEASAYSELTKYIIEFGKEAGISNLSVRGLRLGLAGLVASEVIRGFIDITAEINKMSIAAKETGSSVGGIKQLQDSLRAAGNDASKAIPILQRFNEAARAERLSRAEAERAFTEAGQVPGATQASQTAALNKALAAQRGPFADIGIDAGAYAGTAAGQGQLRQDTARRLLQMRGQGGQAADQAQAASLQIYGQELEAILPQVQEWAAGVAKVEEPTKAAEALQQAYNKTAAASVSLWGQITDAIGRAGQALFVATVDAQKFTDSTGVAIPGTKELAESSAGLGGYASGGYIRGAGSGTSDSILARLSNGEYVVNAASVRALGVGYLDRLNTRRFAAGGLVSAASSSGRPVHLHLGSSSFALSGSSGVVDALVSHAHAQQIRSAGVKPSWFGGRPSGA